MVTDKMPTFQLLAKDDLSPQTLSAYADLCQEAGLEDQAAEVVKALAEFVEWRDRNPDVLKMPDHRHVSAHDQA